mgnify:CR=1 FL=1
MTELHADPLHPLVLDADTGVAELAGVRYLASQPVQAKDGRTVLYLTEASRPMHLFKFVGPATSSGALPHGTLYVASLGADGACEGHGRWLPLVLARHGLSVRDGYDSLQAILADPAGAIVQAVETSPAPAHCRPVTDWPQASAAGNYADTAQSGSPAGGRRLAKTAITAETNYAPVIHHRDLTPVTAWYPATDQTSRPRL